MPINLSSDEMEQLGRLLEEDGAANPAPPEEEAELEESTEPDEVDTINENADGIDEGDAEAEDEEAEPDPNAGADPQAPAYQLPEGIADVNQLIERYNALTAAENQRGEEMQALRELNGELLSVAEALGYTKDIAGVDLSVDEALRESDPEAYHSQKMRREVADQLKPLIETQQRNLRQRMIDRSWKQYAGEHADLAEMMEDIQAVMKDMPELYDSERGMEVAHHMARSRRYKSEKQMMEDDEFIKRAAENPKIKEKIIADYLKEVARGGEGAPATVGTGGRAAAAGHKEAPKTLDEANKGLRKLLGL